MCEQTKKLCLHSEFFEQNFRPFQQHLKFYNIIFLTSRFTSIVIVTASKDRSVGVYRLGGPSHGCTEYKEVRQTKDMRQASLCLPLIFVSSFFWINSPIDMTFVLLWMVSVANMPCVFRFQCLFLWRPTCKLFCSFPCAYCTREIARLQATVFAYLCFRGKQFKDRRIFDLFIKVLKKLIFGGKFLKVYLSFAT